MNPKPSRADLLAAVDKTVRDTIAQNLKVLFCGINPGLYSAFTRNPFARPGNRFWPAIHASGFSERLLHPSEKRLLLNDRYGITNLVARATAAADELTVEELRAGYERLRKKVNRYKPRYLAVLGVVAYRVAFDKPKAKLGLQDETIGETKLWVLPNPSGLNAHFQAHDLALLFRALRDAADSAGG